MAQTSPTHNIELRLREIGQLFNSMDPSPFNEKDLDNDAEEYIVSWAQECPSHAHLRLRIHLDHKAENEQTDVIRQAIHHFFAAKTNLTDMEFRRLLKQGRKSLIIGLTFLGTCFTVIQLLPSTEVHVWSGFLKEGLTIAGWVAMWKPMQIYLYDWWPLRQKGETYEKLSKMPVEVLVKKKL